MSTIGQRKVDHLDLCATDDVAFRNQSTLLEQVGLEHDSLPELHLDEIDLSATLLGRSLNAPIVVAGMTGGTERAREVNRALAAIADRRGYAFGLGSQRAMVRDPSVLPTYAVRDVAPNVLLFGNIGVVQAREMTTEDVAGMLSAVGANALCVHLNPAMELVQPEGDKDFRGGVDTLKRLSAELDVPVIAKETGNGIGRRAAQKIASAGVKTVDVSGAGGTSWVGVETLRAQGKKARLGEQLWDWGVPTAVSVAICHAAGHQVIATGGIRSGIDIARAIALGASAGGMARVVFQAFMRGGEEGAEAFLSEVEDELRSIMLLTGSANIEALRTAPRRLGPALREHLQS